MSVIVYGTRHYGRVEQHAGEYAQTRFFHIWFIPLIPVSSMWITAQGANGAVGHPIKLHPTSVAAGYVRMWGPVAAVMGLVAGLNGSIPALAVGFAATALTIWSWTWRSLRSMSAVRRSDFNFVAFGLRCEPKRLTQDLRAALKSDLDRRWDARKPEQTPNEIARHGTKDAANALLAYGLLRLAALDGGKQARAANVEADQILHGTHVPAEIVDGPYRGTPPVEDAAIDTSLETLVAGRAAQQAAARAAVGIAPLSPKQVLQSANSRSRRHLAGLVLLTLFAFSGIAMFAMAIQPTKPIGIKELRSTQPTKHAHKVRITCDSISDALWEETEGSSVKSRIVMCELGKYLLPVKLDRGQDVPAKVVEGKLYDINDRDLWVRDGLRKEGAIDARSLEVYVDASDGHGDLIAGSVGLAIAAGTPVLWVLWFRARRRRKAAAAASKAT